MNGRQRIAFITGIAGQDGSFLAEHLLDLGYEVHGLIRRHSTAESQESRIDHLVGQINTYYGDMLDAGVLEKLLAQIQPDEIYNLAAMSHVKVSFETPSFTLQTNGQGVLNILEAYRNNCPHARFYQASSSECFGLTVDEDRMQRETTVMNPVSPYGCSKVLGYNLVRHYRRAYNLFACNGILFNHTGIRRSSAFVEAKITKTAAMIYHGKATLLELGNIDTFRDFGASSDYVRAMHMILNHTEADDFVVSSMETHSVRDICQVAFGVFGMDYKNYVVYNSKYTRAEELPYLKGDSTKIRQTLNWKPTYDFKTLIEEMCHHWSDKVNHGDH